MTRRREGEPPEADELFEEVGSAAARELSREVEPVAEEIERQAALGARAAVALAVAGTAGFLAVQSLMFAAVSTTGRRIGAGKAGVVMGGALALVAGAALRVALRKLPRAPGRFILERLAHVFQARASG